MALYAQNSLGQVEMRSELQAFMSPNRAFEATCAKSHAGASTPR